MLEFRSAVSVEKNYKYFKVEGREFTFDICRWKKFRVQEKRSKIADND